MRKNYLCKRWACLCMWATVVSALSAQEISMDAEYRPRGEFRSGYSQPLSKEYAPDLLMMQRVRLNADYKSKLINARLSIQDSRIFGEANQKGESVAPGVTVATPDGGSIVLKDGKAPNLFLYEAWAELVLPKGFAVRIGRQALSYDDQRLFSVCNWSNTGNAHDLALLRFSAGNFKADLGYAYNNDQTNPLTSDYTYGNSFYKNMAYLWLSETFGKSGIKVSAIAVSEGFQEKKVNKDKTEYDNNYRYTFGGNIGFKRSGFPLSAYFTVYGQAGHTKKGDKLNAYLLALKLNYNPVSSWTFTGGIDCFSGTEEDEPAHITHTFGGLYGSNHGFNGAMDYWTSTSVPTGGLVDLYLSAQYKINSKLSILGAFHSFRLQKEMLIRDEKGLGNEIDLDVSYKFCKIATIKAGWSTYISSDLTNAVKGVTGVVNANENTETRFKQWAYISLSITPHLFTYTHKK